MGEHVPIGYQSQDPEFFCNPCAFQHWGVVGNPYSLSSHQTLWHIAGDGFYGIYSWDVDSPHGIVCDQCTDVIDGGWCESVDKGNGNGYCEDCYDTAVPEREDIDE
jgi:hypothetical protein